MSADLILCQENSNRSQEPFFRNSEITRADRDNSSGFQEILRRFSGFETLDISQL